MTAGVRLHQTFTFRACGVPELEQFPKIYAVAGGLTLMQTPTPAVAGFLFYQYTKRQQQFFFFSYLMVQIFILKFCWFKLWFNCSVVLIYGLSITALGVHSGTSICRNLEIKCWSLSVPLHLQCQSKRCTTACHFQHVLAPKYPPCPLRSRVVPLCSLLICLSKLQFVASLSEPRPRNVILQIRYTPLTVFSTPSQEVEIRLTVSLPPLSRARLGGGLLELGFHACLGIGRGNAAFCDLFMEKEKIGRQLR